MPEQKRVADVLAEQAEWADVEHRHNLVAGEDVVYAHLATLATAAAIANVHMETKEHKEGSSLKATINQQGKIKNANRGKHQELRGEIEVGQNVLLVGKIAFERYSFKSERDLTFPKTVDAALMRKGNSNKNHLTSSEVTLAHEPTEFRAPELYVGLRAIHTHRVFSYDRTGLEILSKSPNPDELKDIIKLVLVGGRGKEDDAPYTFGESLLTLSKTHITSLPTAHFAFHEALGVPEETMRTARGNFAALTTHMKLPYTLPDNDS